MNYIKRLEKENKILDTELTALHAGLNDLSRYLRSDKFWYDTTVQAEDVLRRIEELKTFADERKYMVESGCDERI